MAETKNRIFNSSNNQFKISSANPGNKNSIYSVGINNDTSYLYGYTPKVFEKYQITSSLSITSTDVRDAVYCPYNYKIYFLDPNNFYHYSSTTNTITATISAPYLPMWPYTQTTWRKLCYAPSVNRLFIVYSTGFQDSGMGYCRAYNCIDESIVGGVACGRDIGTCNYIPKVDGVYCVGIGAYQEGIALSASTLGEIAGIGYLRGTTQFVYCSSMDYLASIRAKITRILNYYTEIISGPQGSDYAEYITYCPTTSSLYCPLGGNNAVHIFNMALDSPGGLFFPSSVYKSAYYPTVDRIIVACGDNNCYSINPQTKTIVGTISGVGTGLKFLVYNSDNDRMYVFGSGSIISFKYW